MIKSIKEIIIINGTTTIETIKTWREDSIALYTITEIISNNPEIVFDILQTFIMLFFVFLEGIREIVMYFLGAKHNDNNYANYINSHKEGGGNNEDNGDKYEDNPKYGGGLSSGDNGGSGNDNQDDENDANNNDGDEDDGNHEDDDDDDEEINNRQDKGKGKATVEQEEAWSKEEKGEKVKEDAEENSDDERKKTQEKYDEEYAKLLQSADYDEEYPATTGSYSVISSEFNENDDNDTANKKLDIKELEDKLRSEKNKLKELENNLRSEKEKWLHEKAEYEKTIENKEKRKKWRILHLTN